MITVFGEGRGFRVVWLLEEMGLPYRLRDVDLLAGVKNDAEFLAVNPAGFIPAIQDGNVTLVESIAIMEYLMARYGPTPLAPEPDDPSFPAYQQFLHLGEAGLAASIYFVSGARNLAPEAERWNWSAGQALGVFESRLSLVTRQLELTPYLAGETFTAADISVTYALELARRNVGFPLGPLEAAYVARTRARPAYQRTMQTCHATREWAAKVENDSRQSAGGS
jgi:glutathione S-transferase